MIKNFLYIFFFTFFLVLFNIFFVFADSLRDLSDVTINDFNNVNSSVLSSINSKPDIYTSPFDSMKYCVKVKYVDKATGKSRYNLIYTSQKPTINFDGKLGKSDLKFPPGTYYVYDNLKSVVNFSSQEFVISSSSDVISFDGYVVPNYQDNSLSIIEGEATPPGGNPETTPGVIGDINSLTWLINLLLPYVIWLLVLLLCYLILPTLLKKLLNYFLDF